MMDGVCSYGWQLVGASGHMDPICPDSSGQARPGKGFAIWCQFEPSSWHLEFLRYGALKQHRVAGGSYFSL